jgi:hypothetical protein
MGTPVVDEAKLTRDLAAILSKPMYGLLLERANTDAMHRLEHQNKVNALYGKPVTGPYKDMSPADLAAEAVKAAFGEQNKPNLLDPVIVTELRTGGPTIRLYRAYDGISHRTGLTLGRWWCNRRLLKQICYAAKNLSGGSRERRILDFMRSAMFVHSSWNYCTDVAKMEIPAGGSVPVIIGRGSWQAMQSEDIKTEEDVIDKLGIMPIPGPKQIFVPFVTGMWVKSVPKLSPDWPLD